MQITLSIDGKKRGINVEKDTTTLRDVLKQSGLNEETGLTKLNGELNHPLTQLKDGDVLEFINIIYGG